MLMGALALALRSYLRNRAAYTLAAVTFLVWLTFAASMLSSVRIGDSIPAFRVSPETWGGRGLVQSATELFCCFAGRYRGRNTADSRKMEPSETLKPTRRVDT